VTAWLLAQLRDLFEVVYDPNDRRRVPGQLVLGDRVGHDVLLRRVDPVRKRVAASLRPCVGGNAIGTTTLQQRFASLRDLADRGTHDGRVEVRVRPATVSEATAGVLFGTTRRLDYAIQRAELTDQNPHHKPPP